MKRLNTLLLLGTLLFSMSSYAQIAKHALLQGFANSGTQEFFQKSAQAKYGNFHYVAGSSIGNDGHYDILITKYYRTNPIWSATWGENNGKDDFASDLVIDPQGNPIICGATQISGDIDYDGVLLKFNSSGAQQWVSTYGGSANLLDGFVSASTDASGNIYVCGGSTSLTEQSNYLTVKYFLPAANYGLPSLMRITLTTLQ